MTHNQHYGRNLTKETIKDGVSRFFNNGTYLRKEAVAGCVQKVQSILQWFESQEKLNFYASSLLFVYEGSSPQTTKRLNDGTVMLKRVVLRGQFADCEGPEWNNNIHVFGSVENGKTEESVGKSLSKMYALHKKACSKRHHSQVSQKAESPDHDNTWKNSNNISQEHLNGNLLPKLENVFCHVPTDLKESTQVEVRMIDFAHVFPSNGKDDGYIYGLNNLLAVLQSILDD
ncbi:hypothetical protein FKM82_019237 [Ascaphus truei]